MFQKTVERGGKNPGALPGKTGGEIGGMKIFRVPLPQSDRPSGFREGWIFLREKRPEDGMVPPIFLCRSRMRSDQRKLGAEMLFPVHSEHTRRYHVPDLGSVRRAKNDFGHAGSVFPRDPP